ncbi:hypothetical protein [Methanoplanus limicola]|uniref:Uncharacterized protein n=1 Tax=Methanoplanus limicola DSM 2279 TaxID=937775 RepID=H1YX82_9EURY|nr:hypothetical protein [Methanoplanus limicola]EHQ35885.1 hypothetical protein Metlim_1784 [Methanoplanus limicola DSM 2279]
MRIFQFKGRNKELYELPLNVLKIRDAHLSKKSDELRYEIFLIEDRIKELYREAGNSKSESEEVSIARRIESLIYRREVKLSSQMSLENESRALSNLIVLKEHEITLKNAGVWNNLSAAKPEKLELWLNKMNLRNKDRNGIIGEIISITSESAELTDEESGGDLDYILKNIKSVRKGELDPEDAIPGEMYDNFRT